MRTDQTFSNQSLRLLAGLALCTTAACTAAPAAPADEERVVGSVSLPLVSNAPNGDVFVLQNASVEIVAADGSVVTTLVGDDADLMETSLSAGLPVGSYTARLASGWQVAERQVDGSFSPVMAALRGSAEMAFTVTNTATTTLTYVFDIPGGTIVFGGNLEVSFEVRSGFPMLSALAPGSCGSSQDSDGDGTPDSLYTSRYNDQGQLVESLNDWDADGVTDFRVVYGYDSAGNTVSVGSDQDGDGDIDSLHTSAFDLQGRMISSRGDSNSDLSADYGEDWVYDLEGNLIVSYVYSDLPFEASAYDSRQLFTYDAQGRRLTYEYDANTSMGPADGIPESRTTYAYSADGLRVVSSEDSNADGTIDRITTQTLDARGKVLESLYDFDADGVTDSRELFTYDAAGRELRREHDNDLDGDVDYWSGQEYDALGNVTHREEDLDGDGQSDYSQDLEYDSHGNLLMSSQDSDADGVPEYVSISDYSCWE